MTRTVAVQPGLLICQMPTVRCLIKAQLFRRSAISEIPMRLILAALLIAASGTVCIADEMPDPYDALYEAVMARRGSDGKTHGLDSATPLIWNESDHLLTGENYRKLIQRLDAFDALSDA